MASIYKRNGWYWIKFYSGRRVIQYSLKTKDKKLANRYKTKKEAELLDGRGIIINNKKITEFFEEYKEYSTLNKARKTVSTTLPQINRFIEFSRLTHLKQITPHIIQSFIQKILKDGRSPRTANDYLTSIKAFLNYAKRQGYIMDNPADLIRKRKLPQNPPRYLTKSEITQLLKTAEKSHLYPLIITALYTGLRIKELITLEWQDINFNTNQITVRGVKSKNQRFRTIPLHPNLLKILQQLPHHCNFVFTYKKKKYATRPTKAFKTLLKEAGIDLGKQRLFHVLRHSCASWLIMDGVDIYTVAKILGHSSTRTTQIYAHLSQDHIEKAINKLDFSFK